MLRLIAMTLLHNTRKQDNRTLGRHTDPPRAYPPQLYPHLMHEDASYHATYHRQSHDDRARLTWGRQD